jgi:presenilin-like A22 family membrane protease
MGRPESVDAEDDLLSAMREMLPGMIGMAFMFVVTIMIGIWLLPFFESAELYAFGESGTTQVRYIMLELVMIFIFTAFILALAKWKKEWIIKYGLMAVLFLALTYTTVPGAHLLLVDDTQEVFELETSNSVSGEIMTALSENEILFYDISGPELNQTVTIEMRDDPTGEASWTNEHRVEPGIEKTRVLESQYGLTMANGAYVWTVDPNNGSQIGPDYHCFDYQSFIDNPNGDIEHDNLKGGCLYAIQYADSFYILTSNNDLVRMNIIDAENGIWKYQARWNLPPNLTLGDGLTHVEMLDEEHILIAGSKVTFVYKLEIFASGIAGDPFIETAAQPLWNITRVSGDNFTTIDVGLSPYEEKRNLSTWNDTGDHLILIGDESGDIEAWNWKAETKEMVEEDRMKLEGVMQGPISSIRLLDLDSSGRSDVWIADADGIHGLFGTNQIEFVKFTANTSDTVLIHILTYDENEDRADIILINGGTELTAEMGEFTSAMYLKQGLVLDGTATMVGLIIAIVLMILLYIRPEWYVVNTVGVLVGAGVVVMLGITFVPTLVIIFMVLAAIYDAWAVYKSKHMLDLADTMIGLKLPILLVAPQERGYSMLEEQAPMRERVEQVESRDNEDATEAITPKEGSAPNMVMKPKKRPKEAMFMGLGDVIFPGMLVVSAVQWLPNDGFLVGMITMLGGLCGYMALMTYVARGKPQAGLPLLNGGAILGYLIGGLILVGTAAFEFGITF